MTVCLENLGDDDTGECRRGRLDAFQLEAGHREARAELAVDERQLVPSGRDHDPVVLGRPVLPFRLHDRQHCPAGVWGQRDRPGAFPSPGTARRHSPVDLSPVGDPGPGNGAFDPGSLPDYEQPALRLVQHRLGPPAGPAAGPSLPGPGPAFLFFRPGKECLDGTCLSGVL